jgi:hypothetical protein
MQLFRKPALFTELLIELAQLLVQQVIRLVNEADQGIRCGFRSAF